MISIKSSSSIKEEPLILSFSYIRNSKLPIINCNGKSMFLFEGRILDYYPSNLTDLGIGEEL